MIIPTTQQINKQIREVENILNNLQQRRIERIRNKLIERDTKDFTL